MVQLKRRSVNIIFEDSEGKRGRTAIDISKDTLKLYLRYGFTKTKMAKAFAISTKTISRQIESFGLQDCIAKHSDISDSDLDNMVIDVFSQFPNCGIRGMKGCLQLKGFKIQWARI